MSRGPASPITCPRRGDSWAARESNPHTLRYGGLNPARLPFRQQPIPFYMKLGLITQPLPLQVGQGISFPSSSLTGSLPPLHVGQSMRRENHRAIQPPAFLHLLQRPLFVLYIWQRLQRGFSMRIT